MLCVKKKITQYIVFLILDDCLVIWEMGYEICGMGWTVSKGQRARGELAQTSRLIEIYRDKSFDNDQKLWHHTGALN